MVAVIAVVRSSLFVKSNLPVPLNESVAGLRISGNSADVEGDTDATASLLTTSFVSGRASVADVEVLPANVVVPLSVSVASDDRPPRRSNVAPVATVMDLLAGEPPGPSRSLPAVTF